MRNDSIETREIADTELDNVSGGVLGVSVNGLVGPVIGAADTVAPVSSTLATVEGLLPAQATGLIAGL